VETIYDYQHKLNQLIGRDTINSPDKLEWLFDYAFALSDECHELMNCCSWKWWSKDVKNNTVKQYKHVFDIDNAKIEAVDCLHFLISIFQILDMSPQEIERIYKMKWEANIKRQQNNYDVRNKTEDDNEEIKRSI